MTRRRLDLELVHRKLVPSRSAARAAIEAGHVEVGGVPEPKPATMVAPSDSLRIVEQARFVGRGGEKLEAGLDAFPVDVMGREALDVGASTGGFTDCLLQRGAASVVALDVGYGQLHWRLRSDPRVRVVDRTNIRHADAAALGAPFDIVVADLSFISLVTVAEALESVGGPDTDYLLLVKPQFEVGKDAVGRGGIVRDPALHAGAIEQVTDGLAAAGIGVRGGVASPIRGAKGNAEFIVWGRKGRPIMERSHIDRLVGV